MHGPGGRTPIPVLPTGILEKTRRPACHPVTGLSARNRRGVDCQNPGSFRIRIRLLGRKRTAGHRRRGQAGPGTGHWKRRPDSQRRYAVRCGYRSAGSRPPPTGGCTEHGTQTDGAFRPVRDRYDRWRGARYGFSRKTLLHPRDDQRRSLHTPNAQLAFRRNARTILLRNGDSRKTGRQGEPVRFSRQRLFYRYRYSIRLRQGRNRL